MRFLQYEDLDLRRVEPDFDTVRAIEADDLRSVDAKKPNAKPYVSTLRCSCARGRAGSRCSR